MTFFISMRDIIKRYYQKFQFILQPIGKFAFSFLFFWSLYQMFQFTGTFHNFAILLGFAFVGMWLPLGVTFFLSIFFIEMELLPVLPEIGILYGVVFLLLYLLYIRFHTNTCIPMLIVPIAMVLQIPYLIPILVGLYVGTIGIIPMIFGIILYYFSVHIKETMALLGTATDTNESVEMYRNLLSQVFLDKEMLLTILVFSVVVGILWTLSRMSHQEMKALSVYISGVVGILLFLMGGYLLEVEMEVVYIVIGFVLSMMIGAFLQFIKCTLDFSRVEYAQFEDDDYYYYVKAVPKVSVAQKEVSVKKINVRKQ